MTSNKTLESQQQVYPQFINPYPVENEISLVDLWIAFLKFKKIFFASFLLFLVSSLIVVTLFKTNKYNMTSIMSIGETNNGRAIIALLPPEAVINKINTSILPSLTRSTSEKENIGVFSTTVRNPKETNLVVIENRVNGDNYEVFTNFQRSIIDTLLAEHLELSREINASTQQELEDAKVALQELKSPRELAKRANPKILAREAANIELIKLTDKVYLETINSEYLSRIKILEDVIQVLGEKILSMKSQVDALGVASESSVKKLVLLERIASDKLEIKDAEKEKLGVERGYQNFKLETSYLARSKKLEVESIESEIVLIESNWKADIKKLESKVSELQNLLKSSNSRVVSISELSLKPVGLTKNMAYAIVAFLSIFAAFFITLLGMFRTKVNERLAEEG